MGALPTVHILIPVAHRSIGERLLRDLGKMQRRGEIGARRLYVARAAPQDLPAPAIVVTVLDALAGAPAQAQRPSPGRDVRVLVQPVYERPEIPIGAGERWVELPAGGQPPLGRPEDAESWSRLLDCIGVVAAELVQGVEHDANPLAPAAEAPFQILFARAPRFTGRAPELERLRAHLRAGEIVTLRPSLDTVGCGAGVTSLAVEYAHRFRSCYPGGVWWATYDPDRRGLDLYERRHPFALWGFPGDAISVALGWLQRFEGWHLGQPSAGDGPAALLIVDAADQRMMRDRLTTLGCHVIVLSDIHDLSTPDPTVNVGLLSVEDTAEWLAPFTSEDRGAAGALAAVLAGLPLTLRIAAGHLAAHPGLTTHRYIAELALAEDASCGDALEAAFRLAWQSIEGTQAAALLQTMALLGAGRPVPEERLVLLTDLAPDETGARAAVTAALDLLVARGLADRLTDGAAALHPRLYPLARATVADPVPLARAGAVRLALRLADVERLARETMARGTKSVVEDVDTAYALFHLAPSYDEREARDCLDGLRERLCEITPVDRDRPLSRAALLQQLAFGLPSFHESRPSLLRQRAMAAISGERDPHLVVRGPADPAARFRDSGSRRPRPSISSDGSSALIAGSSGEVVLWDARRAGPIRSFPGPGGQSMPRGVAVAADALVAAFLDRHGRHVDLRDLTSGEMFARIAPGREGQLRGLALTPDGRFLACLSSEGDVLFADVRDPAHPRSRAVPRELLYRLGDDIAASLSGDGRRAVLSVRGGHALWVWDLARDTVALHELPEPARTASFPYGMWTFHDEGCAAALTADGRTAFTAAASGKLVAWDLDEDGAARVVASDVLGSVRALECTADGALLITLSRVDPRDYELSMRWPWGALQVRDAASGALVCELLCRVEREEHLAASPDGRAMVWLATAAPCFVDLKNPPGAPP